MEVILMTRWTVFMTMMMTGLVLGMRIRGALLLAGGLLLLGGLIFSLRCYRQSRPVFGALLWSSILSCILFLMTFFVPNIRMWELLYL